MITQQDYTDESLGSGCFYSQYQNRRIRAFSGLCWLEMALALIETLSACTAFPLGSEALLESDRVRSILSRQIVDQTLDIGL
jgi:hypothetical protein